MAELLVHSARLLSISYFYGGRKGGRGDDPVKEYPLRRYWKYALSDKVLEFLP